jgi:hypothetical protein
MIGFALRVVGSVFAHPIVSIGMFGVGYFSRYAVQKAWGKIVAPKVAQAEKAGQAVVSKAEQDVKAVVK